MTKEQLKPGTRVEWVWNTSCDQNRVIPATVSEWTKNGKWVWIEFESRGLTLRKMVQPSTLRVVATAAA